MGRLSEALCMTHCTAEEWTRYSIESQGRSFYLSRIHRHELKEMRRKYRQRVVKKSQQTES